MDPVALIMALVGDKAAFVVIGLIASIFGVALVAKRDRRIRSETRRRVQGEQAEASRQVKRRMQREQNKSTTAKQTKRRLRDGKF